MKTQKKQTPFMVNDTTTITTLVKEMADESVFTLNALAISASTKKLNAKQQCLTKEEIREQLGLTIKKYVSPFEKLMHTPLFPALSEAVLRNSGFSQYEIKNYRRVGLSQEEDITLVGFLAIVVADIDIFLLMNEDQLSDKDKLFTIEEFKTQAEASVIKILSIEELFGGILKPRLNIPLIPALRKYQRSIEKQKTV